MVKIEKRRVVNQDGTPAKAMTLYGFFALLKNKETGEVMMGGEQPLQGYFLGDSRAAHELAGIHAKQLEEQYPAATVSVQKHPLEKVGPLVSDQMTGLMQEHRIEKLVSTYLAQCISEGEAERSLDINPDLTMESRVQNVLNNARGFIADQVKAAYEQQQARASGVVGPDGQPIASGAVVAEPEQATTAEDLADIALLDASEAEAEAAGDAPVVDNVIPFRGRVVIGDESIAAVTDDIPITDDEVVVA